MIWAKLLELLVILSGSMKGMRLSRLLIDTAAKIAESLGVTIDYLVKEGEYQNIDNETLKRMKEMEKLTPEDKAHVFAMLDAFFAKNKLQNLLL